MQEKVCSVYLGFKGKPLLVATITSNQRELNLLDNKYFRDLIELDIHFFEEEVVFSNVNSCHIDTFAFMIVFTLAEEVLKLFQKIFRLAASSALAVRNPKDKQFMALPESK
jgi:hypothetical protein